MGLAIAVVLIMYFFLLPSRYAGIRYAPTIFERRLVLAIIGGATVVGLMVITGGAIPRDLMELMTYFLTYFIAVYGVTFPVRIFLSFKILNIEKATLCIAAIAGLGYLVAIPLFSFS